MVSAICEAIDDDDSIAEVTGIIPFIVIGFVVRASTAGGPSTLRRGDCCFKLQYCLGIVGVSYTDFQ